uniref:UDP-glucuronosyltransferase n=1 Tax=Trialeurodes vaporariorum TaxID=88556 RepID=A0A873P502_TRIVP|nr:UDP-gluconosyltransferase [Trialeurodes vaporariorum]
MKLLLVTLIVLCISIGCSSYNILVFLPIPVWSHYVQVEPILTALAERGHNLTVYSPWTPKKEVPNFHHTFLTASKLKEMFDLFFASEFLAVLSHKLAAPIISSTSHGYSESTLQIAGALNAFAHLPAKFSNYVPPMTFVQRLDNALRNAAFMIHNKYWYYPSIDKVLAKHVPGPLPSVSSMLKNVSLHFFTGNVAVDGSKLLPPNIVELSAHIKAPLQLPKDVQDVMDRAGNGVVYVAFGSLIKASQFKKENIELLLSVFKNLDRTVLWKADFNLTDVILPKNVIVKNWFDQVSILAHPNCVLFFTHGGISSMIEAINFAVPVIGMPFFADQAHNLAYAEQYGYGLTIKYTNLTHDSLLWSMKTVLQDPKYKKNIKRGSRIIRDSPMSGVDTAIYWIEYVIRHEGAHHLKPVTLQMPWYQELLLDVTVIFVTIFSVFMYILLKIFTFLVFCYRKLRNKSINEKKKTV